MDRVLANVAVIVFARAPGRVPAKTRLASMLGPTEACDVYAWMLRATLERVSRMGFRNRVLAVTPDEGCERLRIAWSDTFMIVPQGGGNLGERLRRTTASVYEKHGCPLLVIGADSPDLPEGVFSKAAQAVRRGQVAICPARDGGYCLIALPRPEPALFDRIDWGGASVARQTHEAARRIGIRLVRLPEWEDVDRPMDLRRLRDRIVASPDPALRKLYGRLLSVKLLSGRARDEDNGGR